MSRKHSNRSHHQPGPHSGARRSSGGPRPQPQGFTGPGYRQLYSRLMPGLAGAEKRQFFNQVSGAVVLAAGFLGAGVGFACLGWIGGVLGLVGGISVGGSYVEKQRLYRR